MPLNIFSKIVVLNLFILVPAYAVALLSKKSDEMFGSRSFYSGVFLVLGIILITLGIVIRIWAIQTFHVNRLRVLSMQPQQTFTMQGPYRYSRNPLYAGIILITWGVMISAGSYTGLVFAFLSVFFWHGAALREEKQLTEKFGDKYEAYKRSVPLWF